ncbi:hypothetical protein [Arenibaculum pallidiluteum]|uniref:hypothetical protein n=1 Tax=Arenibaculum pallidiluteum TaxID=2812559 RepID=UPI001A956842|nr:hypothetical protein [Arenibaculum pallidiluteum]
MDPVILFSLVLVTGALAVAILMVVKTIRATAREIEVARKQCAQLSRMLRGIARESLRLRETRLDEAAREDRLTEECAGVEHAIATLRQRASPLVVLDERKTMGDTLWEVPVGRRSGDPARPYMPWRTFLVWAPSADRARRRVLMRYAESQGFGVGQATERAEFPAPAS